MGLSLKCDVCGAEATWIVLTTHGSIKYFCDVHYEEFKREQIELIMKNREERRKKRSKSK